jgi:hypothetical protein
MADAVAVVLDRAVGVDHGWTVLAVQTAAAKPFLAAAGEDAGRSVCATKPALASRHSIVPSTPIVPSSAITGLLPVETRPMRGRVTALEQPVSTPFLGLFAG